MIYTRQYIADAFKSVESQAREGHYLDRRIAVARAIGRTFIKYETVLQAFKEYMRDSCKPMGLDEFIKDFDDAVLHVARHAGLSESEIRPIVWAVDYSALRSNGLDHLRNVGYMS